MNFFYLNAAFGATVLVWSIWCGAVPGVVREGVVGRIIFAALGLSTFALMVFGILGQDSQVSEVAFNGSIAALAVRHWWGVKGRAVYMRKRARRRERREHGQ